MLADALTFVAWLPASWIATVAKTFASAPLSTIPWPPGVIGGLLSFGFSTFLIWAILGNRKAYPVISAILVGCLGLGLSFGSGLVAWAGAPHDWSWAQCNVGQGDAVVVRNGGKTALIDTGRSATALTSCLAKLGISRVDLLVITHFDIDHIGGYEALLGKATVAFYGPTDGEADVAILNKLATSGTKLFSVSQGDVGSLGIMNWQVLWPPKKGTEPGNPSSVVMRWTPNVGCHECVSAITLGDLPALQQTSLLTQGQIGFVDLVKVSHHGSRDQDPNLYMTLHAPIALIGVGAGNGYGHPTQETIEMLAGSGSTTIRSDQHGIALIWRDAEGTLRVWTEHRKSDTLN
jgi:competence protein ComEC